MKKLTNYAPGPRGVTVYTRDKDGKPNGSDVIWIDPGKSASVDPKDIVEPLPDLGDKPGAVDTDEVSQVEALTAERDELKQIRARRSPLFARILRRQRSPPSEAVRDGRYGAAAFGRRPFFVRGWDGRSTDCRGLPGVP
jgi:hypothetical protein